MANETAIIECIVPPGMQPGMKFIMEFEGQQIEVFVPAGVGPGQALRVQVPEVAPAPIALAVPVDDDYNPAAAPYAEVRKLLLGGMPLDRTLKKETEQLLGYLYSV